MRSDWRRHCLARARAPETRRQTAVVIPSIHSIYIYNILIYKKYTTLSHKSNFLFLYIYIYIYSVLGFFLRAAAAEVLCAGRGEVYNHEFPTGIHFRSRRLYCRRGYIFSSFLPRRFIWRRVRTKVTGRAYTLTHTHAYIYYKSVAPSRVVIYIYMDTIHATCVCVRVWEKCSRITAADSSRRVLRES